MHPSQLVLAMAIALVANLSFELLREDFKGKRIVAMTFAEWSGMGILAILVWA